MERLEGCCESSRLESAISLRQSGTHAMPLTFSSLLHPMFLSRCECAGAHTVANTSPFSLQLSSPLVT